MAEKAKILDVWIVESETVYREVPFTVVSDWLQQGRLLGQDRVRPAGGAKWYELAKVPAFVPYLPRIEPLAIQDAAEALEPVELDLQSARVHDSEDEDVDMIPLIDISLVLLIFFMMTASVTSGVLSPIDTPPAHQSLLQIGKGEYWVGLDTKSDKGAIEQGPDNKPKPWYSLGKDANTIQHSTLNAREVSGALKEELAAIKGEVNLRIRADQALPIETIRQMQIDLQEMEAQLNRGRTGQPDRLVLRVHGEVSEPKGK